MPTAIRLEFVPERHAADEYFGTPFDKIGNKLGREGPVAGERDLVTHTHPKKKLVLVVCEFNARTGEQAPVLGRVKTDWNRYSAVTSCVLTEGVNGCPDAQFS